VQVDVPHSVSLNCLSNCSEQEVNVVAHRCIPSLADQNIYSNHHLCQQQTALLILSFRPPRLGTVLLANLLIADKGRRWCRLTISPSCGASFLLHHLPCTLSLLVDLPSFPVAPASTRSRPTILHRLYRYIPHLSLSRRPAQTLRSLPDLHLNTLANA
jgi:hypothetical protein